MTGLISETSGSAGTDWAEMGGQVPSSAFEATPWLRDTDLLASSIGNTQATYGTFDDYGRPITPPEPAISAADANKQYGIPGRLSFSNDIPASVAADQNAAKHTEMLREDAASRRPSGISAGLANFGMGTAAMLLDPVDVASLFIPVLPEGRIAEGLAAAGLEGVAGRTAARVATGAASGAIQMGALALPRYALSQQEQADYGASDMLWDTLYGAALGGAAHGTIGLAREAVGGADEVTQAFEKTRLGQVMASDPDARQAVMKAALAAVVEDRPVDVEPLGDLYGARVAQDNANAVLRIQARNLEQERDTLRGEAAAVPNVTESAASPDTMVRPPALDPATQARLDAIDEELTNPTQSVTATRAAQLTSERDLITQGGAPGSELEQARSESQRQGLLIAAQRADEQAQAIYGRIADSETARQAAGAPPREVQATSDSADIAAKAPPVRTGTVPPEITQHIADLEESLGRADATGLLTDADRAEMASADGWLEQAQRFGSGALQAAACVARGMM